MQDVHDMNYDTVGLPEHIGMLKEDQKRVFEQVCGHLEHQHRHEFEECKCKKLKPIASIFIF